MKYFAFISVLMLLMSGCAAPKSQERIKFENNKLLHDLSTLKKCRIQSAKKLDDGVSSAEIIATAVIQDCAKDSNAVMDHNMFDWDDKSRESFRKQMNGVDTSGVLGIILKQRNEKEKK
jgi:hypothetical protein